MRIARTLAIALTFVTSMLVARADSFSISGNVYAGSDMMGFKVSSLLDGGSQWRSAAPCCGPTIVAISQMGQKTTFDFTAFAWQGEGFAEATGLWGTTTNLGGSIFVSGTILFNSSLTGSVSIKVPVLVVGNLQALDANNHLLGTLNFERHGVATLLGVTNGPYVEWYYAGVDFPKTVVPEPASLLLVGSGFLAVLRAIKR